MRITAIAKKNSEDADGFSRTFLRIVRKKFQKNLGRSRRPEFIFFFSSRRTRAPSECATQNPRVKVTVDRRHFRWFSSNSEPQNHRFVRARTTAHGRYACTSLIYADVRVRTRRVDTYASVRIVKNCYPFAAYTLSAYKRARIFYTSPHARARAQGRLLRDGVDRVRCVTRPFSFDDTEIRFSVSRTRVRGPRSVGSCPVAPQLRITIT